MREATPAAALIKLIVVCLFGAGCGRPTEMAAHGTTKPISFSILEDYDKGADLAGVAADFDLFRELGVTTWRGSFGWNDYEPARGQYDFEWLHRFADLAASRGITLRPYIAYTPRWAADGGTDKDVWNDPPKNLDDWTAFIHTLATDFARHQNIASFEIYHEENVRQWWDGTPEVYLEALRRASDTIRAANPRVQVFLGGMAFADQKWIEQICGVGRGGSMFGVLPFHAYPETWTPAGVVVENYLGPTFGEGFVQDADSACGRKPIWMNEVGFATLPGRTEDDQARWWIRAVATFLAEPRVEHLGIYEIKDLEPATASLGGAANYHLGITTTTRRKKEAFSTLKLLVSLLGQGGVTIADRELRLDLLTDSPDDVYRHAFVLPGGQQLVLVWTRQNPATVSMKLPIRATSVTEYGVNGAIVAVTGITKDTIDAVALQPGMPRMFVAVP